MSFLQSMVFVFEMNGLQLKIDYLLHLYFMTSLYVSVLNISWKILAMDSKRYSEKSSMIIMKGVDDCRSATSKSHEILSLNKC